MANKCKAKNRRKNKQKEEETINDSKSEKSNNESDTRSEKSEEIAFRRTRRSDKITLHPWVKDIIEKNTRDLPSDVMTTFFLSDNPDFRGAENFLQGINDQIRKANAEHNVRPELGTINYNTLQLLYESWILQLNKAKEDQNPSLAWDAFDAIHDNLARFMRQYHLPPAWNVSASSVEAHFGPRQNIEGDQSNRLQAFHCDMSMSNISSDEVEDSGNDEPAGLDALEIRAFCEQRRISGGKVLFWWKKGTGSQTFVRYGPSNAPIY